MRSERGQEDDRKDPKPAPGALALVQGFVNTVNYFRGGDLLDEAEGAGRRLAELGLLGRGEGLGEAERRRLVDFREALRGVLLAHNGGAAAGPSAGTLNGLAAAAALGVRFEAGGRPALGPADGNGPAERVVARLLAEVFRAEAEGRWGRLKACANEGCRWAFYDASKNGMGRWCNMQVCGARHKMRAYRERKADSG